MNTIRQIKVILYRLKRDFGQPLTILTRRSMTQNVMTGAITVDERVIKVKRAIVLDNKMKREFSYDLSFIASNKNFTYGGLYDTSTRSIIIDGVDLPRDYAPTINDRCVHNNERYQIKDASPTVYDLGWIFTMLHLDSQATENITEASLGQIVAPSQEATNA